MQAVTITGIVKKGKGRGKGLGFPTANIPVGQTIPEGIFVSHVTLDGQPYNAVTFVGPVKTFNETDYQAETYILDFNQDIYGQKITITLLKKLRANQQFESQEELIKQMEIDISNAHDFFRSL